VSHRRASSLTRKVAGLLMRSALPGDAALPNDHVVIVSSHSSAPFADSLLRKWYHPQGY
jgi:hypothetical protein